jgi:hypothetical protein
MTTILDIKKYMIERKNIRINSFGYVNTRIIKLPISLLKGFVKQLEKNQTDHFNDMSKIRTEIEFREICNSLRDAYTIKIK